MVTLTRKAVGVCLILLLVFAAQPFVVAQSSNLEARIARLETENLQMRIRIDRLESMSGVSRPSARNSPLPAESSAPSQLSSTDSKFERLATLVIELKERVNALEKRFTQLAK
jgi:uncharacterized protein YceH (UPF0502 family)